MCEWLSCAEWCDVRLHCGGGGAAQELQAHRAVLASVSSFLRRILLSCPIEETPTFIVLPDFDLDAMSSLLYYIYNGEVVIQKNKLETFMEIARAMQIFVDGRYLPDVCKSTEQSTFPTNEKDKSSSTHEIFCLGDGPFIRLKKGNGNSFLRNNNNINFENKEVARCSAERTLVECENLSETVSFRNVQSRAFGDRQRSFLRDLFIEAYPRNGKANGGLLGVPAIPSVCYRPPSCLPTNANACHLNNDTHAGMKKTTHTLSNNMAAQLHIQETTAINCNQLAHFTNFASSSLYLRQTFSENSCDRPRSDSWKTKWNIALKYAEYLPQGFNSFGKFNNDYMNLNHDQVKKAEIPKKTTTENTVPKGAILNQVLESPWCPRLPFSYRPLRKEISKFETLKPDIKEEKILNDDNNNVQVQTSSNAEDNERICANRISKNANAVPTLLNSRDYKCNVCDQVFTDDDTFSAHIRRHSVPAKYSCTECTKSFSQLRNYKYHMSIHRGTREFAANCTVCGKYFNDRGYLSSHMKIHRNRKEYKCSHCPKSFNQRVAYNMHVRIHTGVKPHVCGECGKAFSRKMLLKQHLRTHSGERPYACSHCDKRFADRSNMTLHLRLHTGIKPFSCTMCPKSFTKKHHLKSHLNFHTGAKPYSCPKCKLAFTQSSNMRTHLKKCTAPDPNGNADRPAS